MKKWICTVCNYVHEGDEPPETCPVCNAPRDKFEPLVDITSSVSEIETLEDVRRVAQEKLRGVCAVYPACDGHPDHICQREAYSARIGFGGVGTGAAFAANTEALARLQLRTRIVGEHFEPDTRVTLFGQELALPVMGSSTAGWGGYDVMDEGTFAREAVQGCLDAGTLCWRGDTAGFTEESHPALDAMEAAGGRGVPIFKPRAQDVLKRLIERAVRAGCPAVGVDLDGCGSTNMARAGAPVFRKSTAELRELVTTAGIPFVAKGIMDPDDAEACAEAGCQVIAVSNHGGRVLDSTPGVAEVLPVIAQRVGSRVALTADGGVRTGFDVLKLLALGASCVLIGRDLIRAVIGGGALGVKLQLDKLQKTFSRALLMTGCPDVASVDHGVFWEG